MLADGGVYVSVVPFVYTCVKVSVSSLGFFRLLVLLINHPILLYMSLLEHSKFKSISRIRGGGNENSLSHISRRIGTRSG